MTNKTPPIIKEFREKFEVDRIYGTPAFIEGKKVIYENEVINAINTHNSKIEQFLLKAIKKAYEQGKKDAKNA